MLWKVGTSGKPVWYGWPDYSGDRPLTERRFKPLGKPQPEKLFQSPSDRPPEPLAAFGVHSSSNGLDVSTNAKFGHVGEIFVAQFGDMAPTVGKVLGPLGFKVLRVNPENGVIEEFMSNKGKALGPASRIRSSGIERPVDVRFNGDGSALYLVDFGIMTVGPQGPSPCEGTGVIWKISRE